MWLSWGLLLSLMPHLSVQTSDVLHLEPLPFASARCMLAIAGKVVHHSYSVLSEIPSLDSSVFGFAADTILRCVSPMLFVFNSFRIPY